PGRQGCPGSGGRPARVLVAVAWAVRAVLLPVAWVSVVFGRARLASALAVVAVEPGQGRRPGAFEQAAWLSVHGSACPQCRAQRGVFLVFLHTMTIYCVALRC